MALYLRANPEMQTRLGMLDGSLQQITGGQWLPVLATARDALLAFVWPGFGDQFLAYNIPGRPVFDAVSAVFFVTGIGVCLWRWRSPVYAFLLLWFVVGIAPSLITGPTANTTRNLAALPAVYLIAAVGFAAPAAWLCRGWRRSRVAGPRSASACWPSVGSSGPAGSPPPTTSSAGEVRAECAEPISTPSLNRSTIWRPNIRRPIRWSFPASCPARPTTRRWRWCGRGQTQPAAAHVPLWPRPAGPTPAPALVVPEATGTTVVIPDATPPHPVLATLLTPIDRVTLAADDLDPGFTLYRYDAGQVRALLQSAERDTPPVNFGGAAELIGARWLDPAVAPGETAELLTVWRVLDPALAGPLVPPSFTTDAVAFTHVLDEAGQVITQRDSLDAPSWAWQRGDLVLQIHPLTAPAAVGTYSAVVGLYDRTIGARLPVVGGGDTAEVPALVVGGAKNSWPAYPAHL